MLTRSQLSFQKQSFQNCFSKSGGKWTPTNPHPTARSRWGWAFIVALCACTALYVGGGVGYAVRAQGAVPRLGSHPHAPLCAPPPAPLPA
jgi:hypothetical protein